MNTNVIDLPSEAETIIKDLALFELLNKYGEARLVGSVALNLIVKRDIDIHIVVQRADLIGIAHKISHALLENNHVKDIRITDHRDRGGIKVGIDSYPGPTGNWSIDLWVTDNPNTTGFALVDHLNQRLTPDQRKIILKIKEVIYSRGELHDGISSQIYSAVVNDGISTVEEFENMK